MKGMFITMAIVNEIKCARCDRKYSGVRSRCPYCGARRIGRGKYSDDSDNAKGKMLISVLIMAVFTVGAAILLFSTPNGADANGPGDEPSISSPEDDIDRLPSLNPEPTPTPTPEPTPVIRLDITSLQITYGGRPWDNESVTIRVGRNEEFGFTIEPPGFDRADDFNITIESSNTDIVEVVEIPMGVDGLYGFRVTKVDTGNARVIVTVVNNGVELKWERRVY